MIWYRHWLEMRFRAAFGFAFILALTYLFRPDHLNRRSLPNASMVKALGEAGARAWNAHAGETAMLVIVMALTAAGSGILSYGIGSGTLHRSSYYTLGLPVTRTKLCSTRFLASWLQICAGFAVALALNCILLSWSGSEIPWRAMAATSLGGIVIAMPATALTGLCVLALGANAGSTAGVVGTLGMLWVLLNVWEVGIVGVIPWSAITLAVVLTAVLFAITLTVLRRREF